MRRITNARLPSPINSTFKKNLWWVLLDDGEVIVSIEPMPAGACMTGDDWGGDWLSPMGIDLQMNGGLGLSFPALKVQDLPKLFELLDRLWIDGVEAIAPTFVSCDPDVLQQSLEVLHQARKQHFDKRCKLLGAHLEGPFLSKKYHGAHRLEYLLEPSLNALDDQIKGFEKEIALVTLAPELPGASEVIQRLIDLDVVVCLGHSAADSQVSNQAFVEGVSMITHAFNAMPGLHHRAPGPLGEALHNSEIALGMIADGVHVHPKLAVMLQRLASERLVLVSDALSPYGLDEGLNHWDERLVFVEQGTCRLEDGTLAGGTLSLLEGCKRLAKWSGESSAAIWSATIAPRQVLDKKVEGLDYLIGQPLKKLLRWEMNHFDGELSWHQAA